MWRYLTGLNRSDLAQEVRLLGAEPRGTDFVEKMVFFKGSNVPPRQIDLIRQHLNDKEIFFQSPQKRDGNHDVLFSISPSALTSLKRQVESAKELADLRNLLENISIAQWQFSVRDKDLRIDHPLIMGVLNITPDSFSDGGKYFDQEVAYRRAVDMLEAGADIIDIGGESTRPGSVPVSVEEEWQRISWVIDRLLHDGQAVISVDTYKSEIARRALDMGAHIINDISGLNFDPSMAEVVAMHQAPVILMHIKGTPRDMQKNPSYENLMDEIYGFLERQCRFARENGIEQVMVDPGIGFGKRPEDNYEIIRRLGEFKGLGRPIVLGTSRKSFIGFGLGDPQQDRTIGTIASVVCGILNGANIVRVHDVVETKQALKIVGGIKDFKAGS